MEEEDASNLAKDGNALGFFPCPAWLGLEEKTLPRTAKELRAHTFDSDNKGTTIDRIISSYIPKVRKGSLSVRQRQILYDILKTLYTLENIAELPEESIVWVLNGVMGETPNVREPYAFEEPFPTLATMTMERIMPEFGFKEPVGDESTPSPPPTTQAPATRKRKRSQPENSRPIRRRIQDIIDPRIRLMMENIELTESSARKCYKIINKALINPADQFGKNGLKMGKWWPYRLNALRDGAHGASQGGIYGNQYGAYSIVLSREYLSRMRYLQWLIQSQVHTKA